VEIFVQDGRLFAGISRARSASNFTKLCFFAHSLRRRSHASAVKLVPGASSDA
jgi:hypothetical protein